MKLPQKYQLFNASTQPDDTWLIDGCINNSTTDCPNYATRRETPQSLNMVIFTRISHRIVKIIFSKILQQHKTKSPTRHQHVHPFWLTGVEMTHDFYQVRMFWQCTERTQTQTWTTARNRGHRSPRSHERQTVILLLFIFHLCRV